jgi:hypothetical protein
VLAENADWARMLDGRSTGWIERGRDRVAEHDARTRQRGKYKRDSEERCGGRSPADIRVHAWEVIEGWWLIKRFDKDVRGGRVEGYEGGILASDYAVGHVLVELSQGVAGDVRGGISHVSEGHAARPFQIQGPKAGLVLSRDWERHA